MKRNRPAECSSRITSDAEYASKPFYAAISILQILLYIMSLGATAPKDMPQALPFLVVTLILAVASIFVSAKICARSLAVSWRSGPAPSPIRRPSARSMLLAWLWS